MTVLFNFSVKNADVPAIWKDAIIVPVLKPGKPVGESSSYRPISLLSPCVKILERLLLPIVNASLSPSETQHGFRPLRSTTTALLPVASQIARGFNQRKPPFRTAVVSVDIAKAFDAVNINLLLKEIAATDLNCNVVRWLAAYLRGRTAACRFNGVLAARRIIHTGFPQGSVLSPSLFNFFVADCPQVTPLQTSYADDFNFGDCDSDVPQMEVRLNAALKVVEEWADRS